MFGWSEWYDSPITIDINTGVATLLGYSGIGTAVHGLAFDTNDVLWFFNGGGDVYNINTTNGLATYVGSIGRYAHHGSSIEDQVLLGN